VSNTFSNLLYHVVFSTKNRVPQIRPEIQESLFSWMGTILREEGGILLAIGGMPEHVHLLLKGKTDASVADLVRAVKANSSRMINQQSLTAERFEWQSGYGVFSVSESQAATVRRYILNQPTHHARLSFSDELVELLRRQHIEFDERYLLG
jgi:putative transposase